jgi:hypothetical protein
MANDLTSVAAGRYVIMRKLGGKQDLLVNKMLLLQKNAMELADKLARVVGRPGWGAQWRKGNAEGSQEGARWSCGHHH